MKGPKSNTHVFMSIDMVCRLKKNTDTHVHTQVALLTTQPWTSSLQIPGRECMRTQCCCSRMKYAPRGANSCLPAMCKCSRCVCVCAYVNAMCVRCMSRALICMSWLQHLQQKCTHHMALVRASQQCASAATSLLLAYKRRIAYLS